MVEKTLIKNEFKAKEIAKISLEFKVVLLNKYNLNDFVLDQNKKAMPKITTKRI